MVSHFLLDKAMSQCSKATNEISCAVIIVFNCVTLLQPIKIDKCPGSGRWSGLELIDLWDFLFWFSFLSDRLRDTLIHEMCHAASWIISGVKAGHGPVWKKWWVSNVGFDINFLCKCVWKSTVDRTKKLLLGQVSFSDRTKKWKKSPTNPCVTFN